jgi:hypothetical protein
MSIRVLALALLAAAAAAQAAPPKSQKPTTDPAPQQAPESIDVDAMARAKDESAATPSDADTPPPAAEPPTEAPPSATPAPEAAPEPPPATAAAPADSADAKPPAGAAESPAQAEERSVAASCVARATGFLDAAEKADFAGATRDFDAKMRTDLPPPKLKQQWDSMAQFGKLVARGQSHIGTGQGYLVVMIPMIFEKTNLVAQIACGSDGRIAGFHVTQAPKPKL